MDANCGLWNAHCSVYKVSLAFKWLIVFRSAMKTRDQTHRVLKTRFRVLKRVCASSAQAEP